MRVKTSVKRQLLDLLHYVDCTVIRIAEVSVGLPWSAHCPTDESVFRTLCLSVLWRSVETELNLTLYRFVKLGRVRQQVKRLRELWAEPLHRRDDTKVIVCARALSDEPLPTLSGQLSER
jgi:hypothetical protein